MQRGRNGRIAQFHLLKMALVPHPKRTLVGEGRNIYLSQLSGRIFHICALLRHVALLVTSHTSDITTFSSKVHFTN